MPAAWIVRGRLIKDTPAILIYSQYAAQLISLAHSKNVTPLLEAYITPKDIQPLFTCDSWATDSTTNRTQGQESLLQQREHHVFLSTLIRLGSVLSFLLSICGKVINSAGMEGIPRECDSAQAVSAIGELTAVTYIPI